MNRAVMTLLDRHTVHDVVTRLFVKTDEGDWDGVRSCLASRVHFDMSSAGAGPPRVRTGEEITRDWELALAPLDATHHQIGSVVVHVDSEAEEADVVCHGIALHHRRHPSGRNTRMYVGRYAFHLCQEGHHWKVDRIRLDLRFAEGGTELETLPM
ncbi:MAG: nuclear transport factor 2 family protein [Gemmatimonadota bacterium]|jgi:hypothetical protein